MALRRWFTERCLSADPRALGLGRIALALTLLLDLARRARGLETWYSNDGLLPNHTLLWKPPFEYTFSLFFAASRTGEAVFGFVLCAIAYAMLLLGVRTRFAQVASFVAVLSLHGRTLFVQNGGDAVLGELALWSCFLPTGRRYSIDALRAARDRADGAEGLTDPEAPVASLAVLAIVAQLATIYFFNAVQKTGPTWRAGTVVHYMLHQDCNDTWLAVWLRPHFTLGMSRVFTWMAWGTEGVLPLLLLSPFAQRHTRRAAVLLVVMLHGGFALFLNLGIFVPAMIAFTPNLLTARDLDALGRLPWVRRLSAQLTEHPLLRRDVAWLVERATPPPAGPPASLFGMTRADFREGLVAVLVLCAMSQALVENASTTHFKPGWQPRFMHATATYLQAFQGWAMYAPDPPLNDMNLYVDAITTDGRHVDPWNAAASPGNRRTGAEIQPHLRQDVMYFAYALRVPWTSNYWTAFQDWILRYPQRTKRPNDAIVRFEAFMIEHDSPPPGEQGARNTRKTSLFKYPP
ncbi:MAG TPA: HTTM domain-containing protein [Polyangiaceae bacterium]|nr:HTTM domain-containing protein [Polyangiaceae bacterium]